jgi:hypothetical protein
VLWPALALAVALQVSEVEVQAEILADVVGGSPAVSHHPGSGPRREPDILLTMMNALAIEPDRGPPQWSLTTEFSRLAARLQARGTPAVAGTHGLSAELPTDARPGSAGADGHSFLLVVESRDTHPWLGSGIALRLHLPVWIEQGRPETSVHFPLLFNQMECATGTGGGFLGSWCLGPNPHRLGLLFTTFLPHAGYDLDRLAHLALMMCERARWVRGLVRDADDVGAAPARRSRKR